MTDKQRRARAVAVLGEAFRQKITEVTLQAYELGLNDLTGEEVEQAAAAAIRTCKFMPTVAELRDLASGSLEDRATLAWAEVEHAADVVGSYRNVDFPDPLINGTIRSMGGWPALLAKPESEFANWTRKEFLRTYQTLARSQANGDLCRPLPGLMAATGSGEVRRLGAVRELPRLPLVESANSKGLQ